MPVHTAQSRWRAGHPRREQAAAVGSKRKVDIRSRGEAAVARRWSWRSARGSRSVRRGGTLASRPPCASGSRCRAGCRSDAGSLARAGNSPWSLSCRRGFVKGLGMRTTLVADDGEVVREPSPFGRRAVTAPGRNRDLSLTTRRARRHRMAAIAALARCTLAQSPTRTAWNMHITLTPGRILAATIVVLSAWIVHGFIEALLAACVIAIASSAALHMGHGPLPRRLASTSPVIFTCALTFSCSPHGVCLFRSLPPEAHSLLSAHRRHRQPGACRSRALRERELVDERLDASSACPLRASWYPRSNRSTCSVQRAGPPRRLGWPLNHWRQLADRPLVAIVDDDKSIRNATGYPVEGGGFHHRCVRGTPKAPRVGKSCERCRLVADMRDARHVGTRAVHECAARVRVSPIPTAIITAHPEELTPSRRARSGHGRDGGGAVVQEAATPALLAVLGARPLARRKAAAHSDA